MKHIKENKSIFADEKIISQVFLGIGLMLFLINISSFLSYLPYDYSYLSFDISIFSSILIIVYSVYVLDKNNYNKN